MSWAEWRTIILPVPDPIFPLSPGYVWPHYFPFDAFIFQFQSSVPFLPALTFVLSDGFFWRPYLFHCPPHPFCLVMMRLAGWFTGNGPSHTHHLSFCPLSPPPFYFFLFHTQVKSFEFSPPFLPLYYTRPFVWWANILCSRIQWFVYFFLASGTMVYVQSMFDYWCISSPASNQFKPKWA